MTDKEKRQKRRLRLIQLAALLTSIIAIAAILLAVYAFQQKKEATNQSILAKQKVEEALAQQKIALEQRNIADSNKEQALEQRELALESEKRALQQTEIAGAETRKAEINRLNFLQQQYQAEKQAGIAQKQTLIAETNAREALHQQQLADNQTVIANTQLQISTSLAALSNSRRLAIESFNEDNDDSSRYKAMQAYQINKANNGPLQSNDIYSALNTNWVKSIGYRNQSSMHNLPVHCISGLPNSNIIFTADESGMLYESVVKNNGIQKIAAYPVKEEVRALTVSPDGNKLVLITAAGNGMIFGVTATDMSLQATFTFTGTARAVSFYSSGSFIVLSSKAIARYSLEDIAHPSVLSRDGMTAFASGGSGLIYIANGNIVKGYKQWNDVLHDAASVIQKFDTRVSSLAIDANEQMLAAGTYGGYVWIINLKNSSILWSRALHLSSINDLKFARVESGKLQLASAGADQTIKLIDVASVINKSAMEDIITLKGHNKWIYNLYYTQGGNWLCSTSEDNKVIAWKPTMHGLYQMLTDK